MARKLPRLQRVLDAPALFSIAYGEIASSIHFAVVVALVDLAPQLLLVILGLALLFSPHALTQGTSLGTNPSWHSIAFALPLAMLAYTGLETVANLSEEVRRPGRNLPRSVFGAIGLVVVLYAAIAAVGLSAFPASSTTQLGRTSAKPPMIGICARLRDQLP